jgi:hypothetical protein
MPSWLLGFGLKYLIPDASHSRNFYMLGSVKSDPTVFVGTGVSVCESNKVFSD